MIPKTVIACCHTLSEKGMTISFAEGVTAGKLTYDFSSVPNCGSIKLGSIVCYDRSVKEKLMGISPDVIDKYSAVSPEVTQLLVQGLKELIPADVMIAVTGLAVPTEDESPEKPLGTIFVSGSIMGNSWETTFLFEGSQDDIINQTIDAIAVILLDELTKSH
ncbi:CinA-like protein [Arcticibacter svalbardensis MN12-7]|uniref:CinA-like protein n=1 Tax=Arcticibacter svalbardensis MN12-7 TaxID=1150600 RepID=R9GMX4_9SPHI|nr:nicotinamide-nucleotide amidohydrolase family protein [Arcticibacter svalbardensis]EOR93078.1 CinA-like protein [Arcticibacter svalbardensis MN12-7]